MSVCGGGVGGEGGYMCEEERPIDLLCLDCSPPGSSVHGILQVRILK